eukprot:Gb_11078 [translate_table: standard]
MDGFGTPQSVNGRPVLLHSQVAKIKEEDQYLGEEAVTEGLTPKQRFAVMHFSSHMKGMFMSTSKPTCRSPLGMKPTSTPQPMI